MTVIGVLGWVVLYTVICALVVEHRDSKKFLEAGRRDLENHRRKERRRLKLINVIRRGGPEAEVAKKRLEEMR